MRMLSNINLLRPLIFMCLSLCVSFNANVMAHGMMTPDIDFDAKQNFPPIEDDIKALSQYGGRAQEAGKRLVEQGADILDQAQFQFSFIIFSTQFKKIKIVTVFD